MIDRVTTGLIFLKVFIAGVAISAEINRWRFKNNSNHNNNSNNNINNNKTKTVFMFQPTKTLNIVHDGNGSMI